MKARLYLRNVSPINTSAKISILPVKKRCKITCNHYNGKYTASHEECKQFSVKPSKVTIPPCSGKWITIMFTPVSMEVYAAVLCIFVDEESNEKFTDGGREETDSDEDISEDEDVTDEEDEVGEELFEKVTFEETKQITKDEMENFLEDKDKGSGKWNLEGKVKDDEREAKFGEKMFKYIIAEEEGEQSVFISTEEGLEGQEMGYAGEEYSEDNIEDSFANDRYSWCCLLSGEGLLPILKLTHPPEISDNSTGKYSIFLPPVNAGSTKSFKFGFQNMSYILCKVLIELTGREGIFVVNPIDTSEKLTRKFWTNVPLRNITKVKLKPREEIMFEIKINAKFPGVFTEEINIIPVGNPFGAISITIVSESIRNGIILDGLSYVDEQLSISLNTPEDPSKLKDNILSNSALIENLPSADKLSNLSNQNFQSSSENLIPVKHLLEFREANAGESKVKEFRLVNHSQISYDFEWIGLESIPELQINPRKGILRAMSSMLISAVLSSDNPLRITKVIIKCFLERAVEYCHIKEDIYKFLDCIQYEDVEEENIIKLIESNSLTVSGERNMAEENDDENNQTIDGNFNEDYQENEGGRDDLQIELSELNNTGEWQEDNFDHSEEKINLVEDIGKDYLLLPLLFQATANFTSYSCDIQSEICFGTVSVGMSKSYDVMLMNTGKVPLNFHWLFEAPKSIDNESAVEGETKNVLTEEKSTKPGGVYDPYFAIPSKGELNAAGDFIICKISFSPKELGDYESSLVCRINNLAPGMIGPKASLKGKARHLPYYLNYEECDFISSNKSKESNNRNNIDFVSSSFPDSKMALIEICSTGVGHTVHKTLDFYNCTDKEAIFTWKNMDSVAKSVSEWSCCKLSGIVPPRSKIPMKFSFTPLKLGFFESFWSFSVFDDNGKMKFPNFHMIGISSEPAVYFLPGYIKIKLYYQGMKLNKDISLVNEEDIPLKFQMDDKSCSLENERGMVKIEPTKGLLHPRSKCLIRVKYLPQQIGVTCFHVKFLIERRPFPLVLTVKCGSYELLPDVEFYQHVNAVKFRLVSMEINNLNLGKVREDLYQGFFEITNKGNIPFKYYWHYNEDMAKKIGLKICFSSLEETVNPASTVTCSVSLSVINDSNVENFKILLKISQGPHYIIYLRTAANGAKCIFSFASYNFGKCIVPPAGVCPKFKEAILSIKGKDNEGLMLESKFQSTDYLTVHLKKTVLLFDEEVQVPIKFCPLEMIKYNEKIPFVINGTYEKNVLVKGEGIPIKLELVDPNLKYLDFNYLKVGCKVSKKISVRNYTAKSIDVSFKIRNPMSEVEINQIYLKDESPSGRQYNQSSLNDEFVELIPNTEIHLKREDVIDLLVTFSSNIKLTDFSREIVAVVRDLGGEIPLCIIHATFEDFNVTLTSRCIQFGNVVKGSSSIQFVSLINKGNKKKKYQWDSEGVLDSQFSITPISGYSCPGQNVSFKLKFTPESVNKLIECKIFCRLQGQRNLSLELSGRGTELPPIKETIHFSAPVREKESKSVYITNRSEDIVEVKPLLKGDYFTGADVLVIKPSAKAKYPITYAPMTLTKEGKEHQGIFYLNLPNGDTYSWNLLGKASAPLPSSEVKCEVQSKLWHEEILLVQNWLPNRQRFYVTSELMPGEYCEPTFYISGFVKNLKNNECTSSHKNKKEIVDGAGLKKKKSKGKTLSISSNVSTKYQKVGGFGEPGGYLDVPGNAFSQYKLRFICFEECNLDFKVIFTNQDTGEYLYHKINFIVEDASPEVIEIKTIVRKQTLTKLEIENPFPSLSLVFNLKTELSFVFVPETITVAPKQKGIIQLRCLPLHEGYFTAPLLISCPELGTFNYEIRINAEYALTKECKEMCFTAPLGSSETLHTSPFLHNYADKLAGFTCVVDCEAFSVKEFVQVMPRARKALKVTFEPTRLGSFSATLSCKSEVAGSFYYRFKGMCIPPKIEGPHIVKANSDGTKILFKNVFTEAAQFSFKATEPFLLDSNLKILEPKEVTVINVSLTSNTTEPYELSDQINGSLVISLTDENPQKLKWEHYLKGIYL